MTCINLVFPLFLTADYLKFDAQVSTEVSHSAGKRCLQFKMEFLRHFRFSRDYVHRSYSLPERKGKLLNPIYRLYSADNWAVRDTLGTVWYKEIYINNG